MSNANNSKPIIILDTDIGGDIDDLGALAVLHALADKGLCEIGAIINDHAESGCVDCIASINDWYGHSDILVGRKEKLHHSPNYAQAIADALPQSQTTESHPLNLQAYRQCLANAPDNSAVIATIGWLAEVKALIDSDADEWSTLSGCELIKKKVKNMVIMGGTYPNGTTVAGTDPNFERPGITHYVVEKCPVPITFIGNELGKKENNYGCGERLNSLAPIHPLYIGYSHFFRNPPKWVQNGPWKTIQNWSIWDQITVYFAICNDFSRFKEIRGTNHIDYNGHNQFIIDENGTHRYLENIVAPKEIADFIEELMMH